MINVQEIIWFWAFVWFIMLGIGYMSQAMELKIIGSLVGMLVGLSLFSESLLLCLVLVFANMALFLKQASEQT